MSKLYLQNIIDDISFDNLPAKWQGFDFARFSKNKMLFDFQKQGLQNALKGLWLYFKDKKGEKQGLYNHYQANGFEKIFDYDLKKKQDGKTAKYLLEYDKDYPTTNGKISFAHFINRMSFWMATGSGKTLIIIKLIDLLGCLMQRKEIPKNDILFLAHREDLLDQFKNHIEEFNSFNFDTKINLKNLKDYESVKRENVLPFAKNEITVFYYRSDLISDKQKEKIVNFRNYDNNGKWYILLDEAHKGDKEDGKRQMFYSILSRNGFLFNFSATFTDPRDFATCAFNFNLSKFIEEGYGKHIYVSGSEVTAFRDKDDGSASLTTGFSKIEKQKIVLKTLILLTYINQHFEKIRKEGKELYHRPLLLTLVNSVNKPDADLQLFFEELEKIAKEAPKEKIFSQAKRDLVAEFSADMSFYFEENEKIIMNIEELEKINYKDILQYVFNAKNAGSIEISFNPSDKKQAAFKLVTAERHFALIKTGDMPQWLKDELSRFNVNHRFETEGFFETINRDDSDINILMGSRSFYEGWDSNRPNIILFVNIGIGSDAKKFVLQSVGRGVRIEPIKNKRKRFKELFNAKEVKGQLFNKVKNLILPIESLFVFGTNAENLKEIINTLKTQKSEGRSLRDAFEINPETKKHLLLVPVYREVDKLIAEETDITPFQISQKDFELTKSYFGYIGPKVALVKYDCEPRVLESANKGLREEQSQRYNFNEDRSIEEPELLAGQILKFLGLKMRKLDRFKELGKEIVHFEEIKFRDGDKYKEIMSKIQQVGNYGQKDAVLEQLQLGLEKHKNIQKYTSEIQKVEHEYVKENTFELNHQKVKIKYLANHYYLPVIVSESQKIDYLNHIINVESERKFLEELEEYVSKSNSIFSRYQWMFSKLDQTLDNVGLVYYNQKEGEITNFTPDFVFWLQKGNEYLILFVDPHGTAHRDADLKIDWFKKIFTKDFYDHNSNSEKIKVKVKLLFKPARGSTIIDVSQKYREYWFDNFADFANKIS